LLQALLLNEPEDLIDWAKSAAKPDIAALAVQVFEAASKATRSPPDILEAAAESLAEDGVHCARKLVKSRRAVRFVLAGSVSCSSRLCRPRARAPAAALARRDGGALAARKRLGRAGTGAGKLWRRPRKIQPPRARPIEQRPGARFARPLPHRTAQSAFAQTRPALPRAGGGADDRRRVKNRKGLAGKERRKIQRSVELIVAAFRRGGRLFYVGAGTSGRWAFWMPRNARPPFACRRSGCRASSPAARRPCGAPSKARRTAPSRRGGH
jgi:hypothetical protein